jgi:hypothetical protein
MPQAPPPGRVHPSVIGLEIQEYRLCPLILYVASAAFDWIFI